MKAIGRWLMLCFLSSSGRFPVRTSFVPLVRINTRHTLFRFCPCRPPPSSILPVPPSPLPRHAEYGQHHPRPHPPSLDSFVWRVFPVVGLRRYVLGRWRQSAHSTHR
ncbi:hypothetical protein BD310DRAFT_778468, partial [Dichomitus squalens]